MITDRIKAMFQFIEFLHSNIENFKQYDDVINELYLLDKKRQKISSKKTFKNKLKYDEVQEQINDKFNIIQENIIQPIKAKATELNICNLNKPETLWIWNITEIHKLKENFSNDDLAEIFSYKNKYLEYRTATKGEAFFELVFFFNYLDKILKTLFDFFKETEQNEFEAFEAKAIQVNDLSEAVKLFQSGHKKFTFPNSFLDHSTIQQQPNIESVPPQPIVKQKPKQKSEKKLTYPIIAAFCKLLDESKIFPKEEDIIERFCQKVCEKYKLNYADNVRQNYSDINITQKKRIQKVKDLIFPKIDDKTKELMNKYLDTKDK